jgi:DNA gyrase/topoisomerase IV subunit A
MYTKNENKAEDDINALNDKITELQGEQDLLESEIACLQRLIWSNFEELIDNAYLLRKAKSELGEERYQKLYEDYMRNERPALLEGHKQKAIKPIYILDFSEVRTLLSEEIPDTKM